MPGIDRSRIVGKEEEDLDDLTCSICHDILEEPVIAQCCRQSFCTICINQWLVDNNSCPIDRKKLTPNQLIASPRIVTNLLNKLNVKCINYGNNCQTIVRFEELANHMKTCISCDSCKTSKKLLSEKQNVINILKEELEKKNKQNEQLNLQVYCLKNLLTDAEKELEQSKHLIPSKSKFNRNEMDALKNARNTMGSISHEINITQNEKGHLYNVSATSLMEANTFFQLSISIHTKIKSNHNLESYNWIVMVVFKEQHYTSYTNYHKRLNITFGDVTIRFSAHQINLPEFEVIKSARLMLSEVKIREKHMNKRLSEWIIKQSLTALKNYNTFNDIAENLKEKLKNKTDNDWCVLVNASDVTVYYTYGKDLTFEINRIRFIVYDYNVMPELTIYSTSKINN